MNVSTRLEFRSKVLGQCQLCYPESNSEGDAAPSR